MTKQEQAILKNVAKNSCFRYCKECLHFRLTESKPTCNYVGETLEDCRLTQIDITVL